MSVGEISGMKVPDNQLARDATQFIRDTENDPGAGEPRVV
jgi:hypothetical protein